MKLKGFLLAALAAATYGTNPAFALPLYSAGMNANSVLLFRYALGLPLLAAMIFYRRRNLRLELRQLLPVAILGILMAVSSLTLFESYNYMNAGIASTLLFLYPIMVALIMVIGFHEKFRVTTAICLLLMCGGLVLLMKPGDGFSVSITGFLLVMLSALTYAIFLVMTNVNKTISGVPTLTLMFYELLFGSLFYLLLIPCGFTLTMPGEASEWVNLGALAILPTVVSLSCTTIAIQCIGPTPTAIFGALEPVTAVVLSITILNQPMSAPELIGGLLIIVATSLVVVSDKVDRIILRVRRMFPSLRRRQDCPQRSLERRVDTKP